jgi:hypothetical protein
MKDWQPSEIDELWHDAVRPKLEDMRRSATATNCEWRQLGACSRKVRLPTLLVALADFTDLATALPTPTAVAAATRIAPAGAQEAFRAHVTVRWHDLVYLLDVRRHL